MIPLVGTRDTRAETASRARAPAASREGPEELRLSVVIATDRRPELLCLCLEAVFAQRLETGSFEVIVVDDGHCADTQALVGAFRARPGSPVVRFVRPRHGHGPAVARNAGWRAAYGRVIAFTDDNTVPDPDWLAHGERALVPGLAALCGWVALTRAGGAGDPGPVDQGPDSVELVAANAFVRRSALLSVGGFDERFLHAWRDGFDLQFRLARDAGPVGRCDDAVVLQPERSGRWDACLREQKNLFFDALLYKKHPRLYRERILLAPPWDHYFIVALTLAAAVLWAVDIGGSAGVSLLLALAGVIRLALRRLRRGPRTPERIAETVLISALIPFLSVYWRLRGAIHFRVLFL